MTSKLKIPLKEFQKDGVAYGLSHLYICIGDEMGLGKTAQAIAIYLESGVKKLAIVAPACLRVNWKAEFTKFCKKVPKIQVFKKGSDFDKYEPTNDVFIISYSMVEKAGKVLKDCEMIIADEAHYLKNMKAKRTEYFHEAVWTSNPKYLTLLTGTPIKNRIPELYSLLVLLSYNRAFTNGSSVLAKYPTYESFCERFCYTQIRSFKTSYGRKEVPHYSGSRNIEELRKLLKDKYIRRKADKVLGPRHSLHQDILLSERVNRELDEVLKDLENNQMHKLAHATVKAKNALHTSSFTTDIAIGIYEDAQSPVIIFTEHVAPTLEMASRLTKYRVARVDGGTPADERGEIANKFQKGYYDFLIATIGSMGTGHNLTKSHHMIFNDVSYVPGDNAQARMRIDRIGQEHVCRYYYIAGSPVHKRINEVLREKEKDISLL